MNEELEAKLLASAGKIIDALESGVTWSADQVPEVVRQFLVWEFWSSIILMSFFIIIAGCLVKIGKWCWNKDADELWGATFVTYLAGTIFIVFAGSHLYNAVKVKVAPGVVLEEDGIVEDLGHAGPDSLCRCGSERNGILPARARAVKRRGKRDEPASRFQGAVTSRTPRGGP